MSRPGEAMTAARLTLSEREKRHESVRKMVACGCSYIEVMERYGLSPKAAKSLMYEAGKGQRP